MYIKRKIDNYLKNYKFEKPLVILGARQVGKTTSIKKFSDSFEDVIYINLQQVSKLRELFDNSEIDDNTIVNILETYFNRAINEDTLIILDEIQECFSLYNALKYFNESEKKYKIIATGSLLDVAINNYNTVPVGQVNLYQLYPLDIEEFSNAINKEYLYKSLAEEIKKLKVSEQTNTQMNEVLDIYFNIGGIPEAVKMYIENKSIIEIKNYLLTINEFYKQDMSKYLSRVEASNTAAIFDNIESQLSKDNQKFMKKHVHGLGQKANHNFSINWLLSSGNILKVCNVTAPLYPLSFVENQDSFRMFLQDTALLIHRSNMEIQYLRADNKLFTGVIAENYIATQLNILSKKLYYFDNNKYEIDFLYQYQGEIYPLEIKASYNTKSKALVSYKNNYSPKLAFKFSRKNFAITDTHINIPLYAVLFLETIIDEMNKVTSN